jgi:Putative Flp pilus-assembly TadE/G-like
VVRLDRHADDGAVALLVAVLATVLFGFAAIVVDLGYARTVKSDAQSTVDAASLAGAGILSKDNSPSAITQAIDAIEASAKDNFGTTPADWIACSATPPTPKWVRGASGPDCILFNNNANNPSKLQVVLPSKHVDSFFGGLLGYQGTDISARAQATIREEDVPGCALCVMGSLDTSGAVRVDGGTDGGSSSAGDDSHVRTGGSITVQAPGAITFASPPNPAGGASYSSPPIVPRPVADPFAGTGHPMPIGPAATPPGAFPSPAPSGAGNCGDDGRLTQHTYRSITVTASVGHPCIATGVIVVTRQMRVRGYLSAVSSAIQLSCGNRRATVCASPRAGGQLEIEPGGLMTAATLIPTEFSVVADPNNTSIMTIDGDLSVDKAIYGRSMPVQLGANATVSTSGRISVASLVIGSGGAVTVTAAGGAAVPGPPFVGLFQ